MKPGRSDGRNPGASPSVDTFPTTKKNTAPMTKHTQILREEHERRKAEQRRAQQRHEDQEPGQH